MSYTIILSSFYHNHNEGWKWKAETAHFKRRSQVWQIWKLDAKQSDQIWSSSFKWKSLWISSFWAERLDMSSMKPSSIDNWNDKRSLLCYAIFSCLEQKWNCVSSLYIPLTTSSNSYAKLKFDYEVGILQTTWALKIDDAESVDISGKLKIISRELWLCWFTNAPNKACLLSISDPHLFSLIKNKTMNWAIKIHLKIILEMNCSSFFELLCQIIILFIWMTYLIIQETFWEMNPWFILKNLGTKKRQLW